MNAPVTKSRQLAKASKSGATPSKRQKASGRKRKDKTGLQSLISALDISSLHDDDITSVMLHCASALNLRRATGSAAVGIDQSSATSCYTKAGDSSEVSIWSGGFKIGEMTEADAKARGIPSCG